MRQVLSGSVTLFSFPRVWLLWCINELCFSSRYAWGRFLETSCAQDGQSTGPMFLCLSLHWQKSDNGFYFIHIQICNKMPHSVRSCPNKPPFVLVAFLNLEIVQLSHCLALPACYPSLLSAHYGRVLSRQHPSQGLSAQYRQPWPALEAEAWLGVSGVPLGLHALLFPALPWSRL